MALDYAMNAQWLISAIREAGANSDAEVLAVINPLRVKNDKAMDLFFGLEPLNPKSMDSLTEHAEAKSIVDEACDFVIKSIKLADLKEAANLPEIATVAGRTVNLDWYPNYNRDGWQAEVDQGVLRELEKDNPITMQEVEDALAKYGDSAMYNVDPSGEEVPYLLVFKDLESRRPNFGNLKMTVPVEYTVEPGKLNNGEAEFYSVYVKGITSFYGEGANHLSDFPDQASAQAFSQHLQDNAPALKALRYKEPVTVAGVHYSASRDGKYYIADGNLAAGYQTPTVQNWEIKRYLETGELSPVLAANATTHPENLAGLNDFDKGFLLNFADSTQQDPSFFDNMPKCLQDFVWNPVFPPKVKEQPDLPQNKDEWQHRAHAHLDRAQAQLDAVAHHPAVIEYQNINNMPNMPEQAKVIYADTLLRNNPDLRAHYAQAADSVKKAQDAAFMMNKEDGKTDPALLEKANKITLQMASHLPGIKEGISSGLLSNLKSFSDAQQDQTMTMRKP